MKNYFGYIVYPGGEIIGKRGKTIKPQIDKDGYHRVCIYANGSRKIQSVHKIVAICYIDNPENKPQVNHINGNKSDNRVCNLEWVTALENMKHAILNNLHRNRGENHSNSKLNLEQVNSIRKLYSDFGISQSILSKMFSVSKSQIGHIVNNKRWI